MDQLQIRLLIFQELFVVEQQVAVEADRKQAYILIHWKFTQPEASGTGNTRVVVSAPTGSLTACLLGADS